MFAVGLSLSLLTFVVRLRTALTASATAVDPTAKAGTTPTKSTASAARFVQSLLLAMMVVVIM
jgi:hypothetical protein